MPTFSIIIPVYNVERYLSECLESVISQTFSDWEAICINDGSTDGSLEILEQFAATDSRIKIHTQPNGGLSAARNRGMENATGDYILFLDSDDYIVTDALQILNNKLDGQDLICFNGIRFHEEDNHLEIPDPIEPADIITGWDYYNRYALQSRQFAFVCVVLRCYRKKYMEDNNLQFHPGIYHEDNLFTPMACYHAQKVSVVGDVLYYYRIRSGSIMKTANSKHNKDILFVANQLAGFFTQLTDINKTIIYRAITHHYQVVYAQSNSKLDNELHPLVDWKLYKTVSRTKLRHRIHYCLIKMCPQMYRIYVESPKQSI